MTIRKGQVQQYTYFYLASQVVTAAEITAQLGMAADHVTVRGSRRTEPTVVPVEHGWQLRSDTSGQIDLQVGDVLRRIEPAAAIVRALIDRGDVHAGLMMVRYVGMHDGDTNDQGSSGDVGWIITPAQIALLAIMGASLQADEYLDD